MAKQQKSEESRNTASKQRKTVAQKNTGIPYEQVTKVIFDQIVNTESADVRTIEVVHDAKIQGKTLTHQVDVYWKFEVGGLVYQTIVQARDWGSKIKQGHLLEFKGVLDDIPGQPRGIYVTREGYQKGALTLANACGIELFVLRPKPLTRMQITTLGFAEMATRARHVPASDEAPLGLVVEAISYEPEFTNLVLQLDTNIVNNNNEDLLQAEPGSPAPTFKFSFRFSDISLYDLLDRRFSSLEDVVKPILYDRKQYPVFQNKISHDFKIPTYIRFPGHAERTRIYRFAANVHFKETGRAMIPFDFKDVVSFILERIGRDNRQVFRVCRETI